MKRENINQFFSKDMQECNPGLVKRVIPDSAKENKMRKS